jgi:hypothetical protein
MKCKFCNRKAFFKLKNGNWCCCEYPASCEAIRKKNSDKIKEAHKNGKIPTKQLNGKRSWSKGLTKETNKSIKKNGKLHSKYLKKLGNKNPFLNWSKKHPKEAILKNQKQSETRKRLYKEGKLTPALGVGRGKYSYIIYKSNKKMLRSTYEFIFALFLVYKKIDFNYENIRVEYENSTRISDFEINGKIYEIKGISGSHVDLVKEAFEKNGYKIRVVYSKTIKEIRKFLIRNGFDINNLELKIKEGHKNKKYFYYDLDNFKEII